MNTKLIRIFEGIKDLPQECKDKLFLNAHLTEGEFQMLALEIPDYEKKPHQFYCDDCGETKIL